LLSHCGLNGDRALSWAIKGLVDLVVGGHSHDAVEEIDTTQGVPVVQAGAFAERLGRVRLEVTSDGVRVAEVRHEVVADEWPSDPAVLDELAACERDLQAWLDEPVGVLAEPAPWQELYDSAVTRTVTAALLDAYPGDLGVLIAGHCTAGLPAGTVTRGDIWAATASPGNAATATMTGRELRAMVAVGVSAEYATATPRTFRGRPRGALHLVGAELRDGDLHVGGVPVEDDRAYRVTGSDLELSTYGGMVGAALADLVIHTPAILPELLESYLGASASSRNVRHV
ncbi:MAG TPA: 5'-nucleotidase C-terminal domain-containing protein, partial [Kribbellaceae bacterium]